MKYILNLSPKDKVKVTSFPGGSNARMFFRRQRKEKHKTSDVAVQMKAPMSLQIDFGEDRQCLSSY